MKLLEGKKVLIAGVANKRSLAWGIAKAMHAHGAQLAFSCVPNNLRRLQRLAPQVDSDLIIPCDVQNDEDIAKLFKTLGEAWDGELNAFVHSIAFARFDDLEGEYITTPRAAFHLATDVSAYSFVAMSREARPMLKKGKGSVMTLTYNASRRAIPNYNVMGPAKAALESSAIYLAVDLGKDDIRVNVISAGVVRTPSSSAIKGLDRAMDFLEENNPIGRNITADDLGGPAVFLASDLSVAVTGATLYVDGGAALLTGA